MKMWVVLITRHGRREVVYQKAENADDARWIILRSSIDLSFRDINVLGEYNAACIATTL